MGGGFVAGRDLSWAFSLMVAPLRRPALRSVELYELDSSALGKIAGAISSSRTWEFDLGWGMVRTWD